MKQKIDYLKLIVCSAFTALVFSFTLNNIALADSPVATHHGQNPCAKKNPCGMKHPCGMKNPCNPCGMKNPCNPCGMKNPCNPCGMKNPCNPCGMKNPCNPCGMKNPCNPCGGMAKLDPKKVTRPAGSKAYSAERSSLVKQGEKLWNDASIGKSGMACSSCHKGGTAFMPSFKKDYPHFVGMAKGQAGLSQVDAEQMVQLCMLIPMATDALPWGSKELAALTAYSTDVAQKDYRAMIAANPCAHKMNPCGRNPCGHKMNPCGRNPCGHKMNPCGKKNPCGGSY